jgi:hypothetical protein
LSLVPTARAGLIYESEASLLTGHFNNSISGVETDSTFFSGVNFFVSSPVTVTDIGGKFAEQFSTGNNTIFGAIVQVSSQSDQPDLSKNLLGHTLITLPSDQDVENVSGPLALTLTPGWYALVFGASSQFGATGAANAVETLDNQPANTTNGDVTYAIRQSDGLLIFQAAGARYFVEGSPAVATPEPASFTLLAFGLIGMAGYGWRRRKA